MENRNCLFVDWRMLRVGLIVLPALFYASSSLDTPIEINTPAITGVPVDGEPEKPMYARLARYSKSFI